MKAWFVTGEGEPADVMVEGERDRPEPGPGEALVEVAAAGLGLPDVLMCRGDYVFSPQLPFTPGQEAVGVVTAVGDGSQAQVGQRIMGVTAFYAGNGGYADFCIIPDRSAYPAPVAMGDTEAAGFCIPFHTAWVALSLRAQVTPNEVVLVHGAAGGSGSAAVRLAKALGCQVIATASSAEKVEHCHRLGADHVVNHRDDDFVAATLELTDGAGADVVFDPVGGEICERSVDCTAQRGRLLAVGFASGRWGSPPTDRLVMRSIALLGVFVGAHSHDEMLDAHERLLALHDAGRLTAFPETTLGFGDIAAELSRIGSRETLGKSVAAIRSPEGQHEGSDENAVR